MGAAKSVPVIRVVCDEESPFKQPLYLRLNVSDLNLLPGTLPPDRGVPVNNAVLVFRGQKFRCFRPSSPYYYVRGYLNTSKYKAPTYSK